MHDKVKSRSRRAIPAVSKVLDSLGENASPARTDLARPLIVDLVREKLSQLRRAREIPQFNAIVDLVRASIENLRASRLEPRDTQALGKPSGDQPQAPRGKG